MRSPLGESLFSGGPVTLNPTAGGVRPAPRDESVAPRPPFVD